MQPQHCLVQTKPHPKPWLWGRGEKGVHAVCPEALGSPFQVLWRLTGQHTYLIESEVNHQEPWAFAHLAESVAGGCTAPSPCWGSTPGQGCERGPAEQQGTRVSEKVPGPSCLEKQARLH